MNTEVICVMFLCGCGDVLRRHPWRKNIQYECRCAEYHLCQRILQMCSIYDRWDIPSRFLQQGQAMEPRPHGTDLGAESALVRSWAATKNWNMFVCENYIWNHLSEWVNMFVRFQVSELGFYILVSDLGGLKHWRGLSSSSTVFRLFSHMFVQLASSFFLFASREDDGNWIWLIFSDFTGPLC